MKNRAHILLFLIPLTAVTFTFVGCSNQGHDHSTHEHSASATKPYPLDTCLVSGEKLGSMGTPIVLAHEGQEIKFCCKDCPPEFRKEPAKFLAKLKK